MSTVPVRFATRLFADAKAVVVVAVAGKFPVLLPNGDALALGIPDIFTADVRRRGQGIAGEVVAGFAGAGYLGDWDVFMGEGAVGVAVVVVAPDADIACGARGGNGG